MITLDRVAVAQGTFALQADLTLPAARCTAVTGPSGAGKSTLLAAIGGYIDVTAGRIEIAGRDVTRAPPDRRDVAMLFQDGNLFPHLSVAQNVGLGLRPSLSLHPGEAAQVARSLTRVGLEGYGPRMPATLSGGQLSRAALARVLLQNAPVLLLDEPFAALGPALRREMLDLTHHVAREAGATLLMVTHAPGEVRDMVDDLIFVEDGKVSAPRPIDAALSDPDPALQAYLGA